MVRMLVLPGALSLSLFACAAATPAQDVEGFASVYQTIYEPCLQTPSSWNDLDLGYGDFGTAPPEDAAWRQRRARVEAIQRTVRRLGLAETADRAIRARHDAIAVAEFFDCSPPNSPYEKSLDAALGDIEAFLNAVSARRD